MPNSQTDDDARVVPTTAQEDLFQLRFRSGAVHQVSERFIQKTKDDPKEGQLWRPRWFEVNRALSIEMEWAAPDRVYLLTLRDSPHNPKKVLQIGLTDTCKVSFDLREASMSGFYHTQDWAPVESWSADPCTINLLDTTAEAAQFLPLVVAKQGLMPLDVAFAEACMWVWNYWTSAL